MNKELTPLEALEKLDHTICLNFNNKDLKFNLDEYKQGPNNGPIDCKDWEELSNCYDIVEKELIGSKELKKGIAWRKAEYKKELDNNCDFDGIPLDETNRFIVMNLYNIMCALESYYKE